MKTGLHADKLRFARARQAERAYGIDMRKIARHVGDIVRGVFDETQDSIVLIRDALHRYADLLTPWAEATATRMVADAARRDLDAWKGYSKTFGEELKRDVQRAPIDAVFRRLVTEQVGLIRSLPLEAAQPPSSPSR